MVTYVGVTHIIYEKIWKTLMHLMCDKNNEIYIFKKL